MKKRDLGILIGLAVLVLLAAWYFLIISPKRDNLSDLNNQVKSENAKYQANQNKLSHIDQEREAAQQTESDLFKLDKLVPADSQVPSLIIDLQKSSGDAGVQFLDVKAGAPTPGSGGLTIIPFELKIEGTFFDVNDFLYRVENYARIDNGDINVSGRLVNVVAFKIGEPDVTGSKFPARTSSGEVTPGHILLTVDINVFMTSPPPPKASASGAAGGASAGTAGSGGPAPNTTTGSSTTGGAGGTPTTGAGARNGQ